MIENGNGFEDQVFMFPEQISWKLENTIHVWKFPVSPVSESLLSDAEVLISRRFRFEDDRNRFVTGRRSIRFLISKYLSLHPLDIDIVAEKGKKPYIRNPDTRIRFNISHSGQWVLIALAMDELGIDIEIVNPAFDYFNLLDEHFSDEEKLLVVNAEIPVTAFYCLWTRKEALIKAVGRGMPENLRSVSVLEQKGFVELLNKKWKIRSFMLSPEYPVSMAYSGSIDVIGYYDGNLLISLQAQSK